VFNSFDPITTTPSVVGNAFFVPCTSLKIKVTSASKSGSVVVEGPFATSTSYAITIKIGKKEVLAEIKTASLIGAWDDNDGDPFPVDGGTLTPDVD
jgi:hypothetical protein